MSVNSLWETLSCAIGGHSEPRPTRRNHLTDERQIGRQTKGARRGGIGPGHVAGASSGSRHQRTRQCRCRRGFPGRPKSKTGMREMYRCRTSSKSMLQEVTLLRPWFVSVTRRRAGPNARPSSVRPTVKEQLGSRVRRRAAQQIIKQFTQSEATRDAMKTAGAIPRSQR